MMQRITPGDRRRVKASVWDGIAEKTIIIKVKK